MIVVGLVILFILLAQAAPPSLYIPLYCIFTTAGVALAWWERRRLADRRAHLERELAEYRPGRAEEE
ncbi:MAG: hypothetical protein R3248_09350 [Candidatus Promineifilaceae bacterium]|nr:hypothetical protein [Candidatus Promineifilaceae bacterium]